MDAERDVEFLGQSVVRLDAWIIGGDAVILRRDFGEGANV